ncbi:MAG: ABC transporter ATP-binding protein [Ilumatobacteraceae bacterium]
MKVSISGLRVEIDAHTIVHHADLEVAPGTIHGLIGPNGSGKSTLLRCVYRALRPAAGVVHLGDDDLWRDLSAKESARRRAVVSQDSALDFDYTVRDVVAMGRMPHSSLFGRAEARDAEIIEHALDAVSMGWAARRLVGTLSGGERQRVFLARAIAQDAPVLLLDEPTNHLDVRAQLELLELVRSLGLTTLTALHDLDHAASVCDALTVLEGGSVVATGTPTDVLTPALIREVFGVDAHIGTHPLTGRMHIAVAPLTTRP